MTRQARAELKIINKLGLHARAAAKFVRTTSGFACDVKVGKLINGSCEECVSGKSILGLMMLGAENGSVISVSAEGDDSEDCVTALTKLLEEKFGEE